MARRGARRANAKGDPTLGFAFLALMFLALLFVLGTIVGVIALFVVAIRNAQRLKSIPAGLSKADFAASPDEQLALAMVTRSVAKTQAAINALEASGAHLNRRKDGKYHEGSQLGRDLNGRIDVLSRELVDQVEKRDTIASLPWRRLRDFAEAKGACTAGELSLLALGLTFFFSMVYPTQLVVLLSLAMYKAIPWDFPDPVLYVMGGLSLATLVGWLCYWIIKPILQRRWLRRLEEN